MANRQLLAPQEVIIYHDINLEPDSSGKTAAYDIDIDIDDAEYKAKMRDILSVFAPDVHNQVLQLEEEVCVVYFHLCMNPNHLPSILTQTLTDR